MVSVEVDSSSALSIFVNGIRVRSFSSTRYVKSDTLVPFVNKGMNTVTVSLEAGELKQFSIYLSDNDEVPCAKSLPMCRSVTCRFRAQPSYDLTAVEAGSVRLDEPLEGDEVQAILEPKGLWWYIGQLTLYRIGGLYRESIGPSSLGTLSGSSIFYYSYKAPIHGDYPEMPKALPAGIEFRVYFQLTDPENDRRELKELSSGRYGLITFFMEGRNHPIAFLSRRQLLSAVSA